MKKHEELMRMRKDELVEHARENARKLNPSKVPVEVNLTGLDKRALAHLIIGQVKRLSVNEARQGE